MTGAALLRGQEVSRILSCRSCSVMAGVTGAKNLCMVDSYHWIPDCRAVAILADIRAQYMRLIFTGCVNAIVATHAITNDIDVVESSR